MEGARVRCVSAPDVAPMRCDVLTEVLRYHRDGQQLVALRQQHNQECKGLMLQIRYLKAKFTRESTFRCDLGYQKQYLTVLPLHYRTDVHNSALRLLRSMSLGSKALSGRGS